MPDDAKPYALTRFRADVTLGANSGYTSNAKYAAGARHGVDAKTSLLGLLTDLGAIARTAGFADEAKAALDGQASSPTDT